MSILSRLFRRDAPMNPATLYNLIDGGSPFAGTGGGYGDGYGPGNGAPWNVEQIATAQACISAISSGIASLPPRVYRTDATGKAEVTTGPFAQLFRRPNRHITYCDLIQWLTAETLIWGNGLLYIEAGPDGTPVSLNPIPWKGVNVLMLASGDVVYDVPNGQGGMNRLLAAELIHIRERSTGNPLVGTPRLAKCPDVVRAALGAQNFAVQVFEHGSTPSGIVGLAPGVSTDGIKRAEAHFNGKHTGNRRVLFMQVGETFTPLDVTLENSQNLEFRRYSAEEIARVFQVPAILAGINDHSTMTNSETSGRFFAQHCLAGWALRIETAIAHALFDPNSGYSLELDMTALQRGSDTERWACWAIAIANGVLSPADVRTAEGWSGPPPAAAVTEPMPPVIGPPGV